MGNLLETVAKVGGRLGEGEHLQAVGLCVGEQLLELVDGGLLITPGDDDGRPAHATRREGRVEGGGVDEGDGGEHCEWGWRNWSVGVNVFVKRGLPPWERGEVGMRGGRRREGGRKDYMYKVKSADAEGKARRGKEWREKRGQGFSVLHIHAH